MNEHKLNSQPFLILLWSGIFLFSGRAFQHLFSSTPYRALFWDENWIPVDNWGGYVSRWATDQHIENWAIGVGVVFIICTFLLIFYQSIHQKILTFFLVFGTALLSLLFFLEFKEHFFQFAQLLEYAIQWSCPFFIYSALKKKSIIHLVLWMKIAIAITFIGHGIYAIGWGIHPMPFHFVEMTQNILNVNDEVALVFLRIAGMMDFIVAILIFFPGKLEKSGLIYAASWGCVTALARTVFIFSMGELATMYDILIHLPDTIYRLPHALLPLCLLVFRKH